MFHVVKKFTQISQIPWKTRRRDLRRGNRARPMRHTRMMIHICIIDPCGEFRFRLAHGESRRELRTRSPQIMIASLNPELGLRHQLIKAEEREIDRQHLDPSESRLRRIPLQRRRAHHRPCSC